MGVGILGYGLYLPRYRVERKEIGRAWGTGGRGESTVCNMDEDVITMASTAANNALIHLGMGGAALDGLYFASTTGPYAEGSPATLLKMVLGGKPTVDAVDFNSSTRGGTLALKGCVDAIKSGRLHKIALLAADSYTGHPGSNLEKTLGSGAAALVLGDENPIAEIEAAYSYSTYILDRWRDHSGTYLEEYEPKFTRRRGYEEHIVAAVSGLLAETGTKISDYNHVVLQASDSRSAQIAARKLGAGPEQIVFDIIFNNIGDTGNSSVFLGLIAALEQAKEGERILVASYGFGGSDAISFIVKNSNKKLPDNLSFSNYLKSKTVLNYVEFLQKIKFLQQADVGAKPAVPLSSPLLWRDNEAILQHLGVKCKRCGYVNYPPSQRIICIKCGAEELERVNISKKGRIHTYVLNYKLPPPLESPLPIIVADLDDGVRHRALGTEMGSDDLDINKEVELVLRLIAVEKGARLYGYKYNIPR